MRSTPVILGALTLAAATQLPAQQARARTERAVVARPVRARAMATVVRAMTDSAEARAVLGLSTSSGGSRDTLGLLVTSIVSGSPAEKAGLLEGNRLVSINGVDLTLSPVEADDPAMRGLMGRRLQREMRKVEPGDVVHLRVFSDGRTKPVDVKADSASKVYENAGMRFYLGDGGDFSAVPAMPLVAPRPPRPPRPPRAAIAPELDRDRVIIMRERERDAADRARRDAARRLRNMQQQMRGMRFDFDDGARAFGGGGGRVSVNRRGDSTIVRGSGDSYIFRMFGMRFTPVNPGLASYFGDGSEKGLLVLDAREGSGLQAGDVILSVNGKPVREDDTTRIAIDSHAENKAEVLRKGKRVTVTIKR